MGARGLVGDCCVDELAVEAARLLSGEVMGAFMLVVTDGDG